MNMMELVYLSMVLQQSMKMANMVSLIQKEK